MFNLAGSSLHWDHRNCDSTGKTFKEFDLILYITKEFSIAFSVPEFIELMRNSTDFLLIEESKRNLLECEELSVDPCQRFSRCNKTMWAADQIMRDTVEFD